MTTGVAPATPDRNRARGTQSGAILILLPVLNEAANIGPLLDGIDRTLANQDYGVCIIDDGSVDGTLAVLEERATRAGSRIHLIKRQKLVRGSQRGGALRTCLMWGLDQDGYSVFVEMDGDLSHRPEELPQGVALVRDGGCDVAIASKYVPGSQVLNRPWGRRMVSRICSIAVGMLMDRGISDYSNGYRFYNRRAAQLIATHGIRYTSPIYLTEVMALWLRSGMRIRDFPTTYVGRHEGLSKLRFIDLGKAVFCIFEIASRYHVRGFAAGAAGDLAEATVRQESEETSGL